MTKTVKNWLLLALLLHLVAAILSVGYYHSDEHFQILEFVGLKLGVTPEASLPIEYHLKLRSWLQPALYYGITRAAMLFGARSPFAWTLWMRLFSSGVGYLALVLSLVASRKSLKTEAAFRIACASSALLWFLPAFHARLSSENLGGAVFFIAASLLLIAGPRAKPGLTWAIGALFGASFEFRYQCGFMVAGLAAWLLFRSGDGPWREKKLRRLALLGAGCLGAILLGTCIDRWGYGAWTFAPANYFRYNLIENHVADIDTQPFWDFFRSSLTETWPPLGFLLLLSMIVAWVRNPKRALTWATLPLFLTHTIIGHKELRFLFPLIHAAPIFVALSLDGLSLEALKLKWRQSRILRFLAKLLLADDLVALVALSTLPAWMPARFYAEVYERAKGSEHFRLYYKDKNPYEVLGTPLFFYRPRGLELNSLPSFESLSRLIQESDKPIWFFYPGEPLPEESRLGLLCQPRSSTLPRSLLRWNPLGLTSRMTNWVLYECAKL